jgi:hypothetical protein
MPVTQIATRPRWAIAWAMAAVLGAAGIVFITSYDGRSKTQRVSDCLVAAGFDVQVYHDDGKEPIGGDEGLLGPLGDYQARPPSDAITVTRRYGRVLATITVQGDVARYARDETGTKRSRLIEGCVGANAT